MGSATLQNDPSVEWLFNVAETETLALFEQFSADFLAEFDVFAPAETGRTREHKTTRADAWVPLLLLPRHLRHSSD